MRGSIRERGSNRWQVRASLGRDPGTGKYRQVERTVIGNKRAAQRALATLVSEAKQGEARAPEGSLSELLNLWITHIEVQGRAPSTLVRYRSAIRTNIVPALGYMPVAKLTATQLDVFYAALLKRGLHPLSVRKCHAILSAALRQAVRWGWIDRSPIDRTSPPSSRSREIVPPTIEEVRLLLKLCEKSHPDLGSIIHVAVTTGCRRGELCGLRWGDIDFDNSTLVVARSISDVPGDVSVKDTKTHQSRRLALDTETVDVLRRQQARVAARAAAVGCAVGKSAYIWSQALDGTAPYRPDRLTGAFIGLRKQAGLPHVTLQGLRHFAATALAGKDVGVRTIAGRLGHAPTSPTWRTGKRRA